jgi:hypothetical protein
MLFLLFYASQIIFEVKQTQTQGSWTAQAPLPPIIRTPVPTWGDVEPEAIAVAKVLQTCYNARHE